MRISIFLIQLFRNRRVRRVYKNFVRTYKVNIFPQVNSYRNLLEGRLDNGCRTMNFSSNTFFLDGPLPLLQMLQVQRRASYFCTSMYMKVSTFWGHFVLIAHLILSTHGSTIYMYLASWPTYYTFHFWQPIFFYIFTPCDDCLKLFTILRSIVFF
jgi:hypothetical protein